MQPAFRVGIGYDVHRLVTGRRLVLGGVEVPYARGLLGHSDADVVLHAVTDALLGAAGLPDIGELFPDSDVRYKDADSTQLLIQVRETVANKGFALGNIDVIVHADEPKLSLYKMRISENIARLLNLDPGLVSIKAKTTEGLGPHDAIGCTAVALLIQQ